MHLSPHSQIRIFHMLKLHLDTPHFHRMEYMQEWIIKTTQTTIRYFKKRRTIARGKQILYKFVHIPDFEDCIVK